MDQASLQAALSAAQRHLATDRAGALRVAGLPSGLAYLSLPLLQLLAGADDQAEVSDLLLVLVGKPHRRAILDALADPTAALHSLDGASPLGQACTALLDALAAPDERAALGTQMRIQTGDHSTILNPRMYMADGDLHVHEALPDPQQTQRERALIDYLRGLQHECGPLQLSRIDIGESRYQRPMRLEQVYIGLHTERQVKLTAEELQRQERERRTARDEHPTRPLSVLEALGGAAPPRVLLLGAPGSGKSTFVNHLVLCLAGAALAARLPGERESADGWLAHLPGWSRGALLPIRIVLREFAVFAPLAQARKGSTELLRDFLRESLGGHAAALDLIAEMLTNGQAILLLDGLDEVVGEGVLARVVESIAAAAGTYAGSPVVVTCRLLDYQANPRRQIRGFNTETLAPLTDEQTQQFIAAWYAELAATGRQMLGNAAALQQAVATRPELHDLARLPLLLTMMAVVHAGRGALPDARSLLYAECVDLLLLRWRQEPGGPDVLEQLELPQFRAGDLLALMARIGYTAHTRPAPDARQGDQPADLSRAQVQTLLEAAFAPYSDDPIRRDHLVSLMLHAIAGRNGLLLKQSGEQGEVYAFPHRTFQEFLAGYHLKGQRDYYKLCLEHAAQPHWHEALTLMAGYQVLSDGELEKPIELVAKLLDRGPVEQALGGELLNLIGRERAISYDPAITQKGGLWPRARAVLLKLMAQGRAPETPAPLRVRAGLAAGKLCYSSLEGLCRGVAPPLPDPRLPLAVVGPGVAHSANWRNVFDTYWCTIDAGAFWYGDDTGEGEGEETSPLQRVTLPNACKIARYPVTNADYARFIAAGGYGERRWWTEHGWAFLQPGGHRYDDQKQPIIGPRLFDDSRYNNPTQPVVGVSWYEAAAYCAWLTAQGHAQGWLPAEDVIRLPTSLEWERAARYTDKRRYPWGNDQPNAERANYDATGIGAPSPVGCFPQGPAVCGALDLAGNVWEWTATLWEQIDVPKPQKDFTLKEKPVIRGRSFYDKREHLCCGARIRDDPGVWYVSLGFRVIWSPRSSV